MSSITLLLDPGKVQHLRETLERWGLEVGEAPHAHFRARDEGAVLTAYRSGKLLVQGAEAERMATHLAERDDLGVTRGKGGSAGGGSRGGTGRRMGGGAFQARVGTDESGKGDYFGPLVVGGVVVATEGDESTLADLGVRDSKAVGSGEAEELAEAVRQAVPTDVVTIMPPRYNEMYAEVGNLNDLLAWAHARCAANLLEGRGEVRLLVSDEFAARGLLEGRLQAQGLAVGLRQRPGGERADVAVAAASLVARAEFLRRLRELGERTGRRLPPGAGSPVLRAARTLVREHGEAALGDVAKLHFRTTRKVTGGR